MARRPSGAITQVDPGVYKDATGGYFTGTSMDNAVYMGDSYAGGGAGGSFGRTMADHDTPPPQTPSTPPPSLPPTGPADTGKVSAGGSTTFNEKTGTYGPPSTASPYLPGGAPAPTAAYLQSLLAGGMSYQDAISQFNRETGRTTGNEAVYYGPEVHGKPTIGLPGEYLSQEANGWQATQRAPETGGGGGATGGGSYNYQMALQKVQQAIGRTLSQAEINSAFTKFGGNAQSTFTDAGLAPVIDYFKQAGGGSTGPGDFKGDVITHTEGSGGNDQLASYLQQLLAGGDKASAGRDALMGRITGLMDKYGQPVNANDPDIANSTSAYEGSVNRSLDRNREMLAERGHAEGMGSGAFDAALSNDNAAGGRAVGDFQGQLMHDEMLSRRQSLSDMLQQGAGLLSAGDQSNIQRSIAAIDAQLRSRGLDITSNLGQGGLENQLLSILSGSQLGNRGLDVQSQLGNSSLSLQRLLGLGSLDLQRLGLTNQNNQFYDRFAYDQGNNANNLDTATLTSLLKSLGLG